MALIYVIMFTHIAMVTAALVAKVSNTCPLVRYTGSFHADDHVNDHALVGYSYKNVSVSNTQQCFGVCVTDCRCLSYQVSGKRCELMDEDRHTVSAEKFMSKPGYTYSELQQTFNKNLNAGCHGQCRNGCCRLSNPCLNGGTCVDTCDNVKRKFKCNCPSGYFGNLCEFSNCAAYAKDGLQTSGLRAILLPPKKIITVYCDLKSEPGIAWTLIESFAYEHNTNFKAKPFTADYPVNQDRAQWQNYRMSRNDMLNIQKNAELWRATCRYDSDGFKDADYMKGLFSQINILTYNGGQTCGSFKYINIRKHSCSDCKTHFHQDNTRHAYVDDTLGGKSSCGWSTTGVVPYADNFGFYGTINPAHRCVSSPTSTTQWWLGTVVR